MASGVKNPVEPDKESPLPLDFGLNCFLMGIAGTSDAEFRGIGLGEIGCRSVREEASRVDAGGSGKMYSGPGG